MILRINNKDVKFKKLIIQTDHDVISDCANKVILAMIAGDNEFIFDRKGELVCIDIDTDNFFYQYDAILVEVEAYEGWINIVLGVTKEDRMIGNSHIEHGASIH